MKTKVVRSIIDRNITFIIEFNPDELRSLPGWCRTVFSDIERFVDTPLALIQSVQAVALQIYRETKNKRDLDTPPTLEGTLKAENQKVGSGTAGETVDVLDTINTAPETYGAPAPEGGEENGGVVQRLEDLEYRVARLETWVIQLMMGGGGTK